MKYIDFRSDTTTLPTDEMREVMSKAEVGDDIYEDDPTVSRLQEMAAQIVGKEAAVFVPSGTMGNQLCVMSHTKRGEEIICEEDCHIVQHERAGIAMLSQVIPKIIRGRDSIMDIEDIKRSIRPIDIHYPKTSLICLENALSNGTVASLSYMEEISKLARENEIMMHLDGARLFNAATYLQCDVKDISCLFDSVTFCLSKGLCSPVGSIIAGSNEFIQRVKENRKAIGGAMRQSGILAAAGIISLEVMKNRLIEDHINAKYLADKLLELGYVELDKSKVHINMVFFKINKSQELVDKLHEKLYEKGIKINPVGSNYGYEKGVFRFVTHNDISREDIDYAINEMNRYFS